MEKQPERERAWVRKLALEQGRALAWVRRLELERRSSELEQAQAQASLDLVVYGAGRREQVWF